MASPYTWSTSSPGDTDIVAVYPALARARQSTLGAASATGGVLGTLIPTTGGGTPTAGWRVAQDFDDVWLAFNAWYNGTVWAQDNAAKQSFSKHYDVVSNLLEFLRMRAGQTTWEKMLQVKPPAGAIANYLQALAAATGANPGFLAQGSDATVGVDIQTKGGVAFRLIDVASLVNFLQFAGKATGTDPVLSVVGDTNRGLALTPAGTGNISIGANALMAAADAAQDFGKATTGWRNAYLRGTGGVIRYDDTTIMGITEKAGSGGGNYTTTSATYVDVDGTNLAYTVTVPTGWKMRITAMTSWQVSAQAQFGLAITDGTTLLKEYVVDDSQINFRNFGCVQHTFPGDNASHTFKMRFHADGANTATIHNTAATLTPTLEFILMPSN